MPDSSSQLSAAGVASGKWQDRAAARADATDGQSLRRESRGHRQNRAIGLTARELG